MYDYNIMAINLLTNYNKYDLNTGSLNIVNTTTSNSTSTGSLIIAGGIAVRGNEYLYGSLNVSNNTTITGPTTNVSNLIVNSTAVSTSTSIGALIVKGGLGVAGSVYCTDLNGMTFVNNYVTSSLTLTGPVTSTSVPITCFKNGNVISIRFENINVTGNDSSTYCTMGTLPSGYRPALPVSFMIYALQGQVCQMEINSDGSVILYSGSAGNFSKFTSTIPLFSSALCETFF
jgi:hypothetical protein